MIVIGRSYDYIPRQSKRNNGKTIPNDKIICGVVDDEISI
jgi:hypothetical protein